MNGPTDQALSPAPDQPAAPGESDEDDQSPVVVGRDESDGHDIEIDVERWCAVARDTLVGEGIGVGTLDLLFVDPEPMTELHQEHLGLDGPTDVLSFPLDGPEVAAGDQESTLVGGPPPHLGDVVVCPQVAAAQAADHTGSLGAELTLLVVHGVLHVLGHDHAEPGERSRMQARERVHLDRYGFTHPVPVQAAAEVEEGR